MTQHPLSAAPKIESQILSDMYVQLGGRKLHGALIGTGASQVTGCDNTNRMHRFSKIEDGWIVADAYLMWRVNAGKELWKMIVSYEPDDVYRVRLVQIDPAIGGGKIAETLADYSDVYCDDLRWFVQQAYDEAVSKRFGGIPI